MSARVCGNRSPSVFCSSVREKKLHILEAFSRSVATHSKETGQCHPALQSMGLPQGDKDLPPLPWRGVGSSKDVLPHRPPGSSLVANPEARAKEAGIFRQRLGSEPGNSRLEPRTDHKPILLRGVQHADSSFQSVA